ncbi:ribonuclease inhibitor-like [Pangasianodon hypophthalmus]|uniref:ribonuclease inhibitor-like n=1 Tax=Pangasianodon hypophthalmus TaxID=310915 RepID=UPI0023080381|nr:ribonuclease inhibitor-like [Pangasianodon hypophthalmus]
MLLSTGLKSPHCKLEKLGLNRCKLTEESCRVLSSVLCSSGLKVLDLSHNKVKDSGVKLFCAGLETPDCKLETLGMVSCGITEEGFLALDSALRSNHLSHLKELYLDGNEPGSSGVNLCSEQVETVNWKKRKFCLEGRIES